MMDEYIYTTWTKEKNEWVKDMLEYWREKRVPL